MPGQQDGCPTATEPWGNAGSTTPPGTVNGLLLRVIKMELKINSFLQRAAVVAEPCAAALSARAGAQEQLH